MLWVSVESLSESLKDTFWGGFIIVAWNPVIAEATLLFSDSAAYCALSVYYLSKNLIYSP
jgi:hypothetical protein